jgi:hypothetical protein
MRIEAWLAARTEPQKYGFHLWSALIYVDGVLTWSDLHCVGRLPKASFPHCQHEGALVVLRKLAAMSKENLEAGIWFKTDSRTLVEELQGISAVQRDPRCQSMLDESLGLVLWLSAVMTMRWCSRSDNRVAHEVISHYCRKQRILR